MKRKGLKERGDDYIVSCRLRVVDVDTDLGKKKEGRESLGRLNLYRTSSL